MKEDENKLCFIFNIVGEEYEHYIPFFLYFLGKAYSNISTYINIVKDLSKVVKDDMLPLVENNNYKIELGFQDFPKDNTSIKIVRWFIRNEYTEQFDYLYIGDIDILIIKEEPNLMEWHLSKMDEHNICYSNSIWHCDWGEGAIGTERMTGLHFCKRKEWYEKMWPTLVRYRDMIKESGLPKTFIDPGSNKFGGIYSNEVALYVMMKESGININHTGLMNYSGLHLGHSRVPGRWDTLFSGGKLQGPNLTDNPEIRYFKAFRTFIDNNPVFNRLLELAHEKVHKEFQIMIESGNKYIK